LRDGTWGPESNNELFKVKKGNVTIRAEHNHMAIFDGNKNNTRYGIVGSNNLSNIILDGLQITGTREGGWFGRSMQHFQYLNMYVHHTGNIVTADPSAFGKAIWIGYTDSNTTPARDILIKGLKSFHNGRLPESSDHTWHDHPIYAKAQGMRIVECEFIETLSGTDISIDDDGIKKDIEIIKCKFGFKKYPRPQTPKINLVTKSDGPIDGVLIKACDFYNTGTDYAPIQMWRNGDYVQNVTIKGCRQTNNNPWIREWKPANRNAEDHPQVTLSNNLKNYAWDGLV